MFLVKILMFRKAEIMMKKVCLFIVAIAFFSTSVHASEESDISVDVEKVAKEVMKRKKSHIRGRAIKRMVAEYMLEQGDITKEELEIRKEERKIVKKELRELRKSGDKKALEERLDELRQVHDDRRIEFETYLAENPELAEKIKEHRKRIREQREKNSQ